MGQTIRDLGSTIKEAKGQIKGGKQQKQEQENILEDEYAEDFQSNSQHQESLNQMLSQEEFSK